MKRYLLNEYVQQPKLPVFFSRDINQQIDAIEDCNQENINDLRRWFEYIDTIKSHLSDRSIAWDNMDRYIHYRNGAIHLIELGIDVTFIVRTSKYTGKNYVYVFKFDLKPQEFDLNVPPVSEGYAHKANKRVYLLNESQLRRIIVETIRKVLQVG